MQEVNLTLHKFDELDSLIHGIEYIEDNNMDRECYYFLNPRNEELCQKVTYDFSNPYPFLVSGASYWFRTEARVYFPRILLV